VKFQIVPAQSVGVRSTNGCPTVRVFGQGTLVIHLPAGQGVGDLVYLTSMEASTLVS